MTKEESRDYIRECPYDRKEVIMDIEALNNSDEDCISREAVIEILGNYGCTNKEGLLFKDINDLPSVQPKPKTGHCKDCKYFEYDSVAKVDGIPLPLIVAHEICKKWGDGCKTSEDGYCFLFEPQESEE